MNSVKTLISVVDDDESVREALPDLLREFGYSAKAFATGKELLDSSCVEKSKCLILDIAMPTMSGPDLAREVRSRGHKTPIIFITAHADAASRPDVREMSVVCLIKPFNDTDLQNALKKALSLKR